MAKHRLVLITSQNEPKNTGSVQQSWSLGGHSHTLKVNLIIKN